MNIKWFSIGLMMIVLISPTGEAQSKTSHRSKKGSLTPAIAEFPASGVCPEETRKVITAQITPRYLDNIPNPRCARVTKSQRLKIINRTGKPIRVTLGPFSIKLRRGAEGTFNRPFGTYLAPGVHRVLVSGGHNGPELWLQDKK